MSTSPNTPSESPSFLNPINITSNLRAPGEYKYYYNGDTSSQSDSSYFTISSTWHTSSIHSTYKLLSTTYNPFYFVQLFYIPQLKQYSLHIYKTTINTSTESIIVSPFNIITLPASSYFKYTQSSNINYAITHTRIYIAATSFIILNDIDIRILVIDINSGKYITLFSTGINNTSSHVSHKSSSSSFSSTKPLRCYNVLDVFDETYLSNNTKHTRTYVFIVCKLFPAKADKPIISMYYIILNNTSLTNKTNLDLHVLDIGVSFSNIEPFCIKIRKIPHINNAQHKEWYFILILLTHQYVFQYISDYGNNNLHFVLKQYSLLGNDNKQRCSNITHIENGKQQHEHIMKLFMHINRITSLCAVMYVFEKHTVVCKTFLYTDTPDEVRSKLFFSETLIKLDKHIHTLYNTDVYNVNDSYMVQHKMICAFHGKCLIIACNDIMYIFHHKTSHLKKIFNIYEEELSLFMNYENIGCLFMLTKNKLFKFIYNERFDLYLNNCDDDITNNINDYIGNISCSFNHNNTNNNNCSYYYPVFEYSPEYVFDYYKTKLLTTTNNTNTCTVCGKTCTLHCKYCNVRYYCSALHYKYDFYSFHFFECELLQFITNPSHHQHTTNDHKHIALYNNIILMCNKVLHFIFTQIYNDNDYHKYLPFIICLLNVCNNFSFELNTEEFMFIQCCKDVHKEKVLFYMECVFYYFQLNMLKCTFAMKAKLYNLTDCYLRTIHCHLLPKLTRKHKGKIVLPKFGFITKSEFNYLSFLDKPFYNIEQYFINNSDEVLDITKLFIVKYLYALSLMSKFKLKLNSLIDIKDTFVDIALIFEEYFKDSNMYCNCNCSVVSYCYLYICYHLVLIGKVSQTINLLKRMVHSFTEKTHLNVKVLALYNLGILQYAIGEFKVGIHRLETVYKLVVGGNVKNSKIFLYTIDSLALAYLNIKALFKAYILIRMSIQYRKQIYTKENEMKCIKLNVYLNFIIDLYEHYLIMRAHKHINNDNNNEHKQHELISYMLGDLGKEVVVFEKDFEDVMNVVKFIYTLNTNMLTELHNDNPSHNAITCIKEFNNSYDTATTAFTREHIVEREDNIKEYDEDIEIKHKLYDTFTKQQKDEFNKLNTELLKRNVILRDPLGAIELLNINYHPIYTEELKDIINNIKSNCISKEIVYSFKNDKWRYDMFNCSGDSCLFALAKYMNLENIKNMIKVERSKLLMRYKRKNCKSEMMCNKKGDKDLNEESNVISYDVFKMKFIDELVMKEDDNVELLKYLDVNEDYLMELYENVFKKNTHKEFILQNPMLILNYIFTAVNEESSNDNNKMTWSLKGSNKAMDTHNGNGSYKYNSPIINQMNKSYESSLYLHKQIKASMNNVVNHINNNDNNNDDNGSDDNKHNSIYRYSIQLSSHSSFDSSIYTYYYDNTQITICNQVETFYFIADTPKRKSSSNVDSVNNYDKTLNIKNNTKTQSDVLHSNKQEKKKNSIKRNNSAIQRKVNPKSKLNMFYRNLSQSKDHYTLCKKTNLKQDEYLYKFIHKKDLSNINTTNCSFIANKEHSKSNYLDKTKDMSRSSFDNGGSINSMNIKNTISTFKIDRPKRKMNRIYLYNKVKRLKEIQELETAITNIKYKLN